MTGTEFRGGKKEPEFLASSIKWGATEECKSSREGDQASVPHASGSKRHRDARTPARVAGIKKISPNVSAHLTRRSDFLLKKGLHAKGTRTTRRRQGSSFGSERKKGMVGVLKIAEY